jgi:hypothetical protein
MSINESGPPKIEESVYYSANILRVAAGTNCPQGGDAGHGGKTIFRLTDEGATHMVVRVNGEEYPADVHSVAIEVGGDTECATFIEALEFALPVLKRQNRAAGSLIATEEQP